MNLFQDLKYNFLKIVDKYQKGYDKPLRTGNLLFDRIIGGISAGFTMIAAEPKVGKTQFMDVLWILNLYETNPDANIRWLYYSFEVSKEDKIAKFISYFIDKTYGEKLDPDYIKGCMIDDEGEVIQIERSHMNMIEDVYYRFVLPLFGGIDRDGKEVEGKIIFVENEENPTGIKNTCIELLKQYGEVIEKEVEVTDEITKQKKKVKVFSHYKKTSDTKIVLIVDTIRDAKKESGNNKKENLDLTVKYLKDLQKNFKVVCVATVHLNRTFTDIDNIKFRKDFIHPTNDNLKDSGDPAEGCTCLITLFDPCSKRYRLQSHFGVNVTKEDKFSYRTLHVIFNRKRRGGRHISYNIDLQTNNFQEIKELHE
jgi:hypothetical protein